MLRLIGDIRQLTKGVKTNCSMFSTPNKVIQSLKYASKYFIKTDILQGYHQISHSTLSRNLFCFTLEDRVYRYNRASIEYIGSPHYYNHVIQKLLEDILWTHVKIEDWLTEAESIEEAISIFRKVLRCREKNSKLARHKLEFGREVDFTGTHISIPEGYHPTTAKINGILELPPPSNLTELWSFLGCWNQPRHTSQIINIVRTTCKDYSERTCPSYGTNLSRKCLKDLSQSSKAHSV